MLHVRKVVHQNHFLDQLGRRSGWVGAVIWVGCIAVGQGQQYGWVGEAIHRNQFFVQLTSSKTDKRWLQTDGPTDGYALL